MPKNEPCDHSIKCHDREQYEGVRMTEAHKLIEHKKTDGVETDRKRNSYVPEKTHRQDNIENAPEDEVKGNEV